MARRGSGGGTIVIKRIEEGGHGHHGGAWKVAYADFVTAMMAFFLLMWLLSATSEEQRRGLADYFNPTLAIANSQSGTADPFGGRTPHSVGEMTSDTGAIRLERGPMPTEIEEEDDSETPAQPVRRLDGPAGDRDIQARRIADGDTGREGGELSGGGGSSEVRSDQAPPRPSEAAQREQAALESMVEELRRSFLADPVLAELARQVLVEIAPEGLRIQLLEADGQPMFASGGAVPAERARAMIRAVAEAASRLPNPIQITGHTDGTPFRGGARSNWDLSTERANAARRLLVEGGVAEGRIRGVTGMADREPLLPAEPQAAGNRRVAITLLRQEVPR